MHIPDGVLSGNVSIIGYVISFCIYGMAHKRKKFDFKLISKISLVTAALFIASLIYVPVGFTSVHFSFVGLAGVILGPLSVYAVGVALFFQMILFHHGGYSTLGVNMLNFGVAALIAYAIFSLHKKYAKKPIHIMLFAISAGCLATIIKVLLGATSLFASGYPITVLASLLLVHIPVILGEGILTGLLVMSLIKLKKEYIYEN